MVLLKRIIVCAVLFAFIFTDNVRPQEHEYDSVNIGLFNRIQAFFLGYVTPEMFGAKGDDDGDDTVPIQQAIDYAAIHNIKKVKINAGKYCINISGHHKNGGVLKISGEEHYFDKIGVGLMLKSNVDIILDNDAFLIAMPTDLPEYAVVYIGEQENITLDGGTIIGDLDNHYGSTGQQGMCIWIQSSSDITIKNCDIYKGWGDCVYIGCKWYDAIPYGSNLSSFVTIEKCKLHHSRRQGISVVGCDGLLVKNCEIYDIAGDDPQAGIDLEVNFKDYPNKNCVFDGVLIHDCKGGGIIGNTTPTRSVKIINSNVQSAQLTCVDGIDIVNSTINYAIFDNRYDVPNDTISIVESAIQSMTLFSAAPYNIKINRCTIGNDDHQPSIAFLKKDNGINKNKVVAICINNSVLSAINNVNLFSISPSIYPNSIYIYNTNIKQYKRTSFFSNEISIKDCYLYGRCLTMEYYSPSVSFVNNTINSEECQENVYGYLLKFNSGKSVVFTGNKLLGSKKESQYIVIPNNYAPDCIISGNDARQYKTIGSWGGEAKVKMQGNKLLDRSY